MNLHKNPQSTNRVCKLLNVTFKIPINLQQFLHLASPLQATCFTIILNYRQLICRSTNWKIEGVGHTISASTMCAQNGVFARAFPIVIFSWYEHGSKCTIIFFFFFFLFFFLFSFKFFFKFYHAFWPLVRCRKENEQSCLST